MTETTDHYQSLHRLSESQRLAVHALAAGRSQTTAAEAAGVHRVTVTRWVAHHPAVIAELNHLRAESASESAAQIGRVTRAALAAVEAAINDGDINAAFKWFRFVAPASVATSFGPIESHDVVEQRRRGMPSYLQELLGVDTERTTNDAEEDFARQLSAEEDL
jgi:hypothetical protein